MGRTMAAIGYWEASAFLLDPYTSQLLGMKNPVYSAEEHLYRIQQSSIIEKVAAIAYAVLHHIRSLLSGSYKAEFLRKAQVVHNAFLPQPVEIIKTADQSSELNDMLTKGMSKGFAEAFETLIKRENVVKLEKFMGTFITLKEAVKLSIKTDEPDLLGGKIVLMLGVENKQVHFQLAKEQVTKSSKPKNMGDDEFQKLLGKPITRMIFKNGFQSCVNYNGVWPIGGYQYPKVAEIGYIDDEHVLIKGTMDLMVGTWEESPRIHTIADLKANWSQGKAVADEKAELKVK